MLREHCKVGMKVVFGRGNGEQTLGEIVKVNPSKCKVKTLESRGNGRGSMVGAVWTVPYSLMAPAEVAFIDEANNLPRQPLEGLMVKGQEDLPLPKHLPYGDKCIMYAIVSTYNDLSPEWLTADGERPMSQVVSLRNKLNQRLRHLFQALGRPVSETVAFDWSEERRKTAV
jgi:hypothetical protein